MKEAGMARAVISPKFQVVIPKEVREQAGLRVGQVVSITARGDILTVVPQRPLADLRGIAKGMPTDDFRDETERF
jgi:AbrB family looped-hinge helix DNA binding protein